ncbi:MAG TPA: DUF1573 domain-containing protein [Puia sp.]|nr:DUF1573 domain-containing protein [Puia sp.]
MQKIALPMRFLPRNRFHPLPWRLLTGAVLTATLLTGCGHANNTAALQAAMKDSSQYTTIQWLDSTKNFGKIPEGQKLQVSFRFKNTGATPLVIARVQPSCGCTVAEQPQEPIAPGGEGRITAVFNSEGHLGINQKSLLVTANTKGSQSYPLRFIVEVDKKAL